ncbi:MAG: glycerophosphodiester phosphodiesterase [Microthrixaceae bacterium]
MNPTFNTLGQPAVLFAHRGARAHAPDNTLEAFTLGLRLGATGLESDVWMTADGSAVLDHDGVVGGTFRRKPISAVNRNELPSHIPSLAELYQECGTDYQLSLDIKDPDAFGEVLREATGAGALEKLWLCHPDLELLASWSQQVGPAKLVHSTRLTAISQGSERHAATLREAGIDAINLHHSEWTAGQVTLFHRFNRLTLGWDAQYERTISALIDMGIDGVFSDHVDRMLEVVSAEQPFM